MYKQLILSIISILCLLFISTDNECSFVNKALAESPSGSYSITPNNTFSSSFRITIQGCNATHFNVYKKSINTVVNSIPVTMNSALNSIPAVYADIDDLEVRVYADSAGFITIAEFTLTGPNQLVYKESTLTQNSPTSSMTSNNKSVHKDNSVTHTLNGNMQMNTANDETASMPKIDNTLSGNTITVKVNGFPVVFDQPPLIINSRTIAPMRAIFEAMGAQVSWDPITQTAAATNGATTIVVKIGSTEAMVNGTTKILDIPAQIINNRTLVPVRFISESLGAKVDWIGTTRTVTINQ